MLMAMMMESLVLVIALCLIFIVLSLSVEKGENMISSYECGFDSQLGSRLGFSYRFFLLSILFLVFDVEISLLLPMPYLKFDLFIVSMGGFFMGILLVGLVYEYFMGVLSWSF